MRRTLLKRYSIKFTTLIEINERVSKHFTKKISTAVNLEFLQG